MTYHSSSIKTLAPIGPCGTHLCASVTLWPTALFLKYEKRLNEPNSKNANHPSNIDDFINFDFFKN
jgi:hypothetical protein